MVKTPFVRFTKLIIAHLCENHQEFERYLRDAKEPKHTFKNDYTIAYVKTVRSSMKIQGIRLPDYFLDEKNNEDKEL